MNDTEILQGTISAVVFQNYENGYAVLRLQCEDGQSVTIVGTVPLPCVGERLMVTGKWTNHPSFGRQFEAEFLERLMPQTRHEILSYLSGRVIKGIGPKLAGRIVQHFGDQTLQILEREPQRLSEVAGISEQKARAFGEEFRVRVGMRQLLEFFTLHHLPAELAVKTYKLYGEAATELLYDDPYLLTDQELDAPFAIVDRFAIELGVDAEDVRRIEAGFLFELRYNLNFGHCFLPEEKLCEATAQMLNVGSETVRNQLAQLISFGRLIRQQLSGITVCYLPQLHEAELYCAAALKNHAAAICPAPPRLEQKLRKAASGSGVEYSQQQKEAIARAATEGLLIITGGPGTGKTTIINGILSLYEQMELTCLLAAPTGRAAKRLTEVTGQEAQTIHRLLGAGLDPKTGQLFFSHDETNPLKAHAIIVDEMSMVDIQLLHSLLRAVGANARLIFVGDPDQLPPVGPGSPFRDMLRSGRLPSVQLTQIFRQAQESLIVMNAHRVNQGQMPQLREVKNDFFFLPCRSEEAVGQSIVGLCATRLPKNMGIAPEQIQVLTPTKKGGAGTWQLNKLLQQSLNPAADGKREKAFGDFIFREGDRVMQIRNNYDILWKNCDTGFIGAGIFNGDVGTITAIDHSRETLSVLFDDRLAEYDFTQLGELEPAYAMTVHKSQGSEYRAVVLAAWNHSQYLLTRSILYTAITRAKELLIIVGREDTIATMVQNAKVGRRYCGLKLRLQGMVE